MPCPATSQISSVPPRTTVTPARPSPNASASPEGPAPASRTGDTESWDWAGTAATICGRGRRCQGRRPSGGLGDGRAAAAEITEVLAPPPRQRARRRGNQLFAHGQRPHALFAPLLIDAPDHLVVGLGLVAEPGPVRAPG